MDRLHLKQFRRNDTKRRIRSRKENIGEETIMVHFYFGDDHQICPMCGFELPIEFFVIIGKILFCRDCAKSIICRDSAEELQ